MEFEEFFKQKNADLINTVGEKDFFANKVYFVDEIFSMVKEWQRGKRNETQVLEWVCLKENEPINCPIFDIQTLGCHSCESYKCRLL